MTADVAFESHAGLWKGWRDLARDAPMVGSGPWLEMRAPKVDGEATTFVVSDADGIPVAGLFATVAAEGVADSAFDVRALLVGVPRTLMTDAPGANVREAVQDAAGDPALWYPHLAVVYPGYECFVVGPGRESASAVTELVDGIVEWSAAAEMKAVAFLYTLPGDAVHDAALVAAGFARWPLTYSCDLTLDGDAFDDYLERLSRKQRAEARRERRLLAERGISTGAVEIEDVFDDLVRLRLHHADRYGRIVSEEKERSRLDAIVDSFGRDNVMVFASRTEAGRVVSFCIVIDHLGEWYMLDTGSDYDDPMHRLAYFEACYYVPVAAAYEHGVRTLHYSLGSWDAKRHRGCTLVPRYGWVKALTPALERILAEWLPRFT